jgi:Family of unknown function (DUF6912)
VSVRLYLPTTLAGLADLHAAGSIPESVDRFTPEDDDEQSEYLALMSAADVSAELLGGSGRRVVVVAEVRDPSAVVPLSAVVAVHADVADFSDPDDDLAWFATQEIPDLLASTEQ